jgi:hypothetical protein
MRRVPRNNLDVTPDRAYRRAWAGHPWASESVRLAAFPRLDPLAHSLDLHRDKSHRDKTYLGVKLLGDIAKIGQVGRVLVVGHKIRDPLVPLPDISTSTLNEISVPVSSLLFCIAGVTCGDDVAPSVESKARLVHRDEVILCDSAGNQGVAAIATSLAEERPHFREVLLSVIDLQAPFLVVYSTHVLQEDSEGGVRDVGSASWHDGHVNRAVGA